MKITFTPSARRWWKLWSNQLALLAGATAAWVVDNQATVLDWISDIGQPWRSLLTFAVVAGLPIVVRSIAQQPQPEQGQG
jgi:hypothetical protein